MDLASTNLFVTLIIGGVVGWLASIMMRTNAQMGILANVVVGIVGSFLGVAVANALGVRVADGTGVLGGRHPRRGPADRPASLAGPFQPAGVRTLRTA